MIATPMVCRLLEKEESDRDRTDNASIPSRICPHASRGARWLYRRPVRTKRGPASTVLGDRKARPDRGDQGALLWRWEAFRKGGYRCLGEGTVRDRQEPEGDLGHRGNGNQRSGASLRASEAVGEIGSVSRCSSRSGGDGRVCALGRRRTKRRLPVETRRVERDTLDPSD